MSYGVRLRPSHQLFSWMIRHEQFGESWLLNRYKWYTPQISSEFEKYSGDSISHRIHGAGRKMLTWLGYIDGIHVTIYSIHGSYGLANIKKTKKHVKRYVFCFVSAAASPCLRWLRADVMAPQEERAEVGVYDTTLRLSVGIEDSGWTWGWLVGWWFGTWILFSPIVWMMIQSDYIIFFRGVETTNWLV